MDCNIEKIVKPRDLKEIQKCPIEKYEIKHVKKNPGRSGLFITVSYKTEQIQVIHWDNIKYIKEIQYSLEQKHKQKLPVLPYDVKLDHPYYYSSPNCGIIITENGFPMCLVNLTIYKIVPEGNDKEDLKVIINDHKTDVYREAQYEIEEKLKNKCLVDPKEKIILHEKSQNSYYIESTSSPFKIVRELNFDFGIKYIKLLRTLSKESSITVNMWLFSSDTITRIFDLNHITYVPIEPQVYFSNNKYYDIHFSNNISIIKDLRILISVLKEDGYLREIFINDNDDGNEIFIGSYYRYANNKQNIFGLTPDEFLKIPEDISQDSLLPSYLNFSHKSKEDIEIYNDNDYDYMEYTEQDAWDALTDGMYGDYQGNYDEWKEGLGY